MRLLSWYRNLSLLKKTSIFICGLFIFGILINKYVELFRLSENYRWIYEKGKLIGDLVVLASLTFSLINFFLLLFQHKVTGLKK